MSGNLQIIKKEFFPQKQVPRPVRLWAKHLIFTWQLEQQIPGVRPEMSDSEEVDLPVQSPGIHEDYGRWLLLFLPHWHAKRGLFDPSKVERTPEQKAHFKVSKRDLNLGVGIYKIFYF